MKKLKPIVNPRKEKEMKDNAVNLSMTLGIIETLNKVVSTATDADNKELVEVASKKLIDVIKSIQEQPDPKSHLISGMAKA